MGTWPRRRREHGREGAGEQSPCPASCRKSLGPVAAKRLAGDTRVVGGARPHACAKSGGHRWRPSSRPRGRRSRRSAVPHRAQQEELSSYNRTTWGFTKFPNVSEETVLNVQLLGVHAEKCTHSLFTLTRSSTVWYLSRFTLPSATVLSVHLLELLWTTVLSPPRSVSLHFATPVAATRGPRQKNTVGSAVVTASWTGARPGETIRPSGVCLPDGDGHDGSPPTATHLSLRWAGSPRQSGPRSRTANRRRAGSPPAKPQWAGCVACPPTRGRRAARPWHRGAVGRRV